MVNFMNKKKCSSGGRVKLVICFSPFQAFIWTVIAKQNKINNANILYISHHDTLKDRHYVDELKKNFNIVEYFIIRGCRFRSVFELNRKLKNFPLSNAKVDLYLASFNTFFAMYIFNKINPESIFLFDDGAFSIIKESEQRPYRFNANNDHLIKKLVTRLWLSKLDDREIINKIEKFYTLFKFDQTLVDRCKAEKILIDYDLGANKYCSSDTATHLRIFIGDVVPELTSRLQKDYRHILKILTIDHYLPHPRSKEICCPQGKALILEVVAEEFIASQLSIGARVTIYSFSSTVLFTLPNHHNLVKIMIKHPELSFPSLYEKCDRYHINLIEYDELTSSLV